MPVRWRPHIGLPLAYCWIFESKVYEGVSHWHGLSHLSTPSCIGGYKREYSGFYLTSGKPEPRVAEPILVWLLGPWSGWTQSGGHWASQTRRWPSVMIKRQQSHGQLILMLRNLLDLAPPCTNGHREGQKLAQGCTAWQNCSQDWEWCPTLMPDKF